MPLGARFAAARASSLFVATLVLMVLLAWVALWRAGASPYAHFIHHAHIHDPLGGSPLIAGANFVAGWTVMTVAMMLPSSLPLIAIFGIVARDKPNRTLLAGLLTTGYLMVWIGAGILAYALAVSFREAAARADWLQARPWVLGSTICVAAGAFQFSSLKYACLDKCRSPFSFVNEHWSGAREGRAALALGLHHGLFCVGCCWALMLLMLPLGAGNLGWMLALGIVMAVEKNVSWGRWMVKPVGIALILIGLAIAVRGLSA